jgi:hypothetical protein
MHREPRPDGTRRGSPSSAPTACRSLSRVEFGVPPPSPDMPAAETHCEYFPHVGLQLPAGVTVHHLCDDFRPAHRLSGQRVWRRGNTRLRRSDAHQATLRSTLQPMALVECRIVFGIVSRSIAAAGMTRLSLAQASERRHLLVPSAVYGKVEKRFLRVSDAPLMKWYPQGHFATFGECHPARASSS